MDTPTDNNVAPDTQVQNPAEPTPTVDFATITERQDKQDKAIATILETLTKQQSPTPSPTEATDDQPRKDSKESAMQKQIDALQKQLADQAQKSAHQAMESEAAAIVGQFASPELLAPLVQQRVGWDANEGKIYYKDADGSRTTLSREQFVDQLKKLKGMDKHIVQTRATGDRGAPLHPHTPAPNDSTGFDYKRLDTNKTNKALITDYDKHLAAKYKLESYM